MQKIEAIKIIDPTSGSGSFLIKVLREIYRQYERIVEETDWVKELEKKDLFDAPANYKPVSYTHLDVYKRQDLQRERG